MSVSTPAASRAAGIRHKDHCKTAGRIRLKLRIWAKPTAMTLCIFLLSFVNWFGVPSPFGAAVLLAFAEKPSPLMLLGMAASMGFRLLWGLELDGWQYAGCALLWALLQKVRPKSGVETAALGGLAMLPRVFAALAADDSLNLLYSVAAMPMAMLSSAALRCGTDAVRSAGAAMRGWERFCVLLPVLLLISGLGYFQLGPVLLGQLAAVWAGLAFAAANGPVYGVLGGMLCGLALALDGHDCRIALSLSLCGLFAGFPPVVRQKWLSLPAVGLGNVLALFVTPLANAPLGWISALCGTMIWVLTPKQLCERFQPYLRGVDTSDRSMENAFVTQRIAHMREAIQKLARALPRPEEQAMSEGEELGELLCAQCANREECWGRGRTRTERLMGAMMEMSRRGEMITEETLPALAGHGCMRVERIDDAAHRAHLLLQRREADRKKARYEREITLTHLAALSGTLGELGVMASGDSYNDLRAAHVISLALDELNIPARLTYARRVDSHLLAALETEGMIPMQRALDQLLGYLAKEENMSLSISRSEKGRIELEEIPLYSASVGTAFLCAEGTAEEVCGDACCAKRCEGGRLLMMLCDGMGHGEEAHRQSEKTLELLLLLLEAGYTRRQAIIAVNSMMLGTEERFSTVDLADVDLWTGEVSSEKLGACASWVVRGGHMKKMEGSSLPLGIVQEAVPTAAQCRLHSGDILVLMSDGVADAFETEEQLKKALEENVYIQPQRMADAVLRSALIAGGGSPRDDMSIMVLLLMDRSRVRQS